MDNEERKKLAAERSSEVNRGNTHSSKNNRLWAETLRRAVIQSDAERLRMIAEALLDKAASGDVSAIKEVGDRLDGKAIATQEITGADGKDLPLSIGLRFVEPESKPD